MTLKILEYRKQPDNYRCKDDAGRFHIVDLAGEFEGVAPVDLVGRTIECHDLIAYVKIPTGQIRMLPRAVPDVSVL